MATHPLFCNCPECPDYWDTPDVDENDKPIHVSTALDADGQALRVGDTVEFPYPLQQKLNERPEYGLAGNMPHGTVEKIYLSDGAPIATFYFPPGAMRAFPRVDDVGIVDRWTDTETRWDAPPECVHRVATTLREMDRRLPSPLGAPEGMGVSQGLGRSNPLGANCVGCARKAEEA